MWFEIILVFIYSKKSKNTNISEILVVYIYIINLIIKEMINC